jgi:Mg/Co/Ni transporter MgtE
VNNSATVVWFNGGGGMMKTDLYTRTVLTVIAACLVWLCVNSLTPTASAQAQPAPQKVVIAGVDVALPVVVTDSKGVPLMGATGLRVNLGEQALPVAIRGIQRTGAEPWEPILVDVLRAAPTPLPTP